MTASISIVTDKDAYNEGETVTATVTTTPPEDSIVGTYTIEARWTVGSVTHYASKQVTVDFGLPAVGPVELSVSRYPLEAPRLVLTEESPGVYVGTIPAM